HARVLERRVAPRHERLVKLVHGGVRRSKNQGAPEGAGRERAPKAAAHRAQQQRGEQPEFDAVKQNVGAERGSGHGARVRKPRRESEVGEEDAPGDGARKGRGSHLDGNGYIAHASASESPTIATRRIKASLKRALRPSRVRRAKKVDTIPEKRIMC